MKQEGNILPIHKFVDIRSLIFDGFLKTTITLSDKVIVLRTLTPAEEDSIIEKYQHLPKQYNLMAATDTVKTAVYSINSCKITNETRELVRDWPKQLIIRLFELYTELVKRIRIAVKLIDDFVQTDESRQKWSVLKATKTTFNSKSIFNTDLKTVSQIQQFWIFLNEQEDNRIQQEIDWKKAEYMTESICTFINPKAMQQITYKKQLEKEEEEKLELIKDVKQQNDGQVIDNSADKLFDALKRKDGESRAKFEERVSKAINSALKEDEHDKFVREKQEYEFGRELRIKKENHRRIKLHNEKRKKNVIVIDALQEDMPNPYGIEVGFQQTIDVGEQRPIPEGLNVGFEQVVTIGNDEEAEKRFAIEQTENKYFVNGIDYSEIIAIKVFEMLKNRDQIFNQIVKESDEETTKWIDVYIQNEDEQTEVQEKLTELNASSGVGRDALLERRERVLSGKNKFEDMQKEMIAKIKREEQIQPEDSIEFGGIR